MSWRHKDDDYHWGWWAAGTATAGAGGAGGAGGARTDPALRQVPSRIDPVRRVAPRAPARGATSRSAPIVLPSAEGGAGPCGTSCGPSYARRARWGKTWSRPPPPDRAPRASGGSWPTPPPRAG